jgi:hypothetical protein
MSLKASISRIHVSHNNINIYDIKLVSNWELVSLKKEYGGLGLPNLRGLNISLLASWLKRYKTDRDKLWKELIDYKYDTQKPNIYLLNINYRCF